jgi:mono/diheme cytochrome c family protein
MLDDILKRMTIRRPKKSEGLRHIRMKKMRLRFVLLIASLANLASLHTSSGASAAQNSQLVHQGQLLAQSLCADCHTFSGAMRSDRAAPDLAAVGTMRSTTHLSLRVFLKSSHANMPNLILEESQIEALSAFILDLGGK